uniref:Nicotinamide riboside kinase 1 n=1 Tax=Leptobrachium leishanense TaxID=445787 RepID=A0A8C5N143_9ANUR
MLWHDLKRAIHTRHPKNIATLKQFCEEEWSKITPDRCAGLICNYRKRLVEVIAAKGGVTNGGKTTLANRLKKSLPNSSLICQDDYFKTDERGFKMYDVLEALNMEDMMTAVHKCIKHPNEAETSNRMGKVFQRKSEDGIYFLIIEGFLLYSYKPLSSVFTRRYFLTVPYEECKKRRSSRVYVPPDPPGYFDGHVWPMYLKHKDEMEETEREIGN